MASRRRALSVSSLAAGGTVVRICCHGPVLAFCCFSDSAAHDSSHFTMKYRAPSWCGYPIRSSGPCTCDYGIIETAPCAGAAMRFLHHTRFIPLRCSAAVPARKQASCEVAGTAAELLCRRLMVCDAPRLCCGVPDWRELYGFTITERLDRSLQPRWDARSRRPACLSGLPQIGCAAHPPFRFFDENAAVKGSVR